MSSKKLYTTIAIDEIVMRKLDQQAENEQRSRSFMVEKILRDHYELPWIKEGQEIKNANKA